MLGLAAHDDAGRRRPHGPPQPKVGPLIDGGRTTTAKQVGGGVAPMLGPVRRHAVRVVRFWAIGDDGLNLTGS
jgi:hypothetical protein